MKNYYTNSYVTFAAGISDPELGLALDGMKHKSMQRLGRLPYRNKQGRKDGCFYLYRRSPNVHRAYRKAVAEGHLLKRGWVFQEWCLSRRIICFASLQGGQRVFYQCRSERPRNEYGIQVPVDEIPFWGRDDHFSKYGRSASEVFDYWFSAVQNYSSAKLSQPEKDRIIALAGIAEECRARLRSIWADSLTEVLPRMEFYVAGLWLQDIHRGLLWEQNCDRRNPRKRLTSFPTWSWASMEGPVQWRPHKYTDWLAKLEDIASEEGDESCMNCSNKFAVIQLRCRLLPVIVRDDFSAESWEDIETLADVPGKERANACFEHPMIRNIRKVCPRSNSQVIHGWGSFEHPEYQHEESFSAKGTVYGLPMSRYGRTISVLFVRPTEVQRPDGEHYERLGVGRVTGDEFRAEYESAEETLLWLR